jgi:hypothetical protein
MSAPIDNHDEDDALQAPPRLVNALQELNSERIFVPPAVDEAVLKKARPQLRRLRSKSRSRWRTATPWVALAASVVFVAFILQNLVHRNSAPFVRPAAYARGDLNHDQTVNILDAFELARAIKQGKAVPAGADMNGDGRVDAADVEIIARRSVSLEKGGHS